MKKVDKNTLQKHLNFIESKHNFMIEWLELAVTFLKRECSWEKFQEREKSVQIKHPGEMIYEKPPTSVMKKNKLDIRTRDDEELSLKNFIIMPPSSKALEEGVNVLHMNTKTSPYQNNLSAKQFIDQLKKTNPLVKEFENDSSTLKFGVQQAIENNSTGLFLEFGFCSGTSLNFIAALAYRYKIYAFDSLEGLKDNWRNGFAAKVFAYKDKNRFPFIPLANTSLIIGWIEETLPVFKQEYLQNNTVAFIHVDSDSYESAKHILNTLKDKITPCKTIIVLDEGYNFSDFSKDEDGENEWQKHEYAAVNQFAEENNLSIKYLAYNKNHQQLVLMFSN